MSTTEAVARCKVVSLDVMRPDARRLSRTPGKSFEEVLTSVDRQVGSEVISFQGLTDIRAAARMSAPPATDLDGLEAFFHQVEGRLDALENGILSLKQQISALLRCL